MTTLGRVRSQHSGNTGTSNVASSNALRSTLVEASSTRNAEQPGAAPLVVAVTENDSSRQALTWAVEEAALSGSTLHIVTAFESVVAGEIVTFDDADDHPEFVTARARAHRVLARAALQAKQIDPAVAVTTSAVQGHPVAVMATLSQAAAQLVVGSRRLGPARSVLLRSVSGAIAARSVCPVVVVRGPASNQLGAPVIVGVDGSEDSRRLIDYAIDHARRRRTIVEVILCWSFDPIASVWTKSTAADAAEAERWLAETIAGVRAENPDVPILSTVLKANADDALISMSRGSDMVVVGNRTRTALGGTIMGSTAQVVLHHTSCPVAIIPCAG